MPDSMSYAEARNNATELKNSAANMDTDFAKLRSEMNSLENVLKSQGADELYQTYMQLDKKLDGFSEKVRNFAGFLEAAADEKEAIDAELSKESAG